MAFRLVNWSNNVWPLVNFVGSEIILFSGLFSFLCPVIVVRRHYVLPLSMCLLHILVVSLYNQLLPRRIMEQLETLQTY